MRTTLTLDEDVAERAKAVSAKKHLPFKAVVNEALRAGLDLAEKPRGRKAFRTKARVLGLRAGLSLDNVGELLAQAEGEDAR